MQIKSVETTPNPNSMKLNLTASTGTVVTYTNESKADCPPAIASILNINGVKSVFACNDFLTVNRDPLADWRPILEQATSLLGGAGSGENTTAATAPSSSLETQRQAAQKEGQIQIYVQTFRGIPIQVRAVAADREARVSLGEKFDQAAQAAQQASGADYLKERYWADHGVRYGPLDQVAAEVADELRGSFDQERLAQALDYTPTVETLGQWLKDPDWHRRLAAVQILSTIDGTVSTLTIALKDENPQVRRLAAAALGASGSSEAVAPLAEALLTDQSVGVRRTAGDALSDIGDVAAQPAACAALKDANKLVRWRAARFLFDVGTSDALPFLQEAIDDKEFEVRLEVEAAIQRIEGGGQGMGPAWKRIIGQ